MSAVASFSWVASLPCALSIRNCAWVYPASAKASVRYGWSKSTHRNDDVVSGRTTPTCRLLAPLVANFVSDLNGDITDATSVENELTLIFGTVFEPPPEPDDPPDDPQAAAARLMAPASATQLTARKLLLLGSCIPLTPFARRHAYVPTRDTIQQVCPVANYASVTMRERRDISRQERK